MIYLHSCTYYLRTHVGIFILAFTLYNIENKKGQLSETWMKLTSTEKFTYPLHKEAKLTMVFKIRVVSLWEDGRWRRSGRDIKWAFVVLAQLLLFYKAANNTTLKVCSEDRWDQAWNARHCASHILSAQPHKSKSKVKEPLFWVSFLNKCY